MAFYEYAQQRRGLKLALLIGVATPLMASAANAATWQTVVNNGFVAPQSNASGQTPYFFSYNQPAINNSGQVVFRARAKPLSAGQGGSQPTRGVYTRSVLLTSAPINVVADNKGVLVPAPNTTGATFIEFPSTPRADALSALIATRGQSDPVVTLPDGTKVGTSGIYAKAARTLPSLPEFPLTTAASLVGSIPAYSYFQVPGEPAGTRFDQFPGSPSPVGARYVAFKGNYTVGTTGKTGVFYRDLVGGTQPVKAILRSGELIPNAGGKVFGSAAPPSSTKDTAGLLKVVFAGFDNEDLPTAGGIYSAELGNPASLRPLVSIGDHVPKTTSSTFNKFGEGISYNGRWVSFWGAWGSATRIVHKDCPTDGNADLIAYCKTAYPSGVDLKVPLNQGIFVLDTVRNSLTRVARTGTNGFTDFLYWTYSGKPPGGTEEEDAELPRWRASAFTAVSKDAMVYKAQKGAVDGLYARRWAVNEIIKVLDTTMAGSSVDPAAPSGSLVSAIGVERDGFRGSRVAITASMLNAATTASWAGIYVHDCGTGCSGW